MAWNAKGQVGGGMGLGMAAAGTDVLTVKWEISSPSSLVFIFILIFILKYKHLNKKLYFKYNVDVFESVSRLRRRPRIL